MCSAAGAGSDLHLGKWPLVEKQEETVALPDLWERASQRDQASVGGEVLSSRYEVLQPLGQGGMAEVWLARDMSLERTIALKLMKAEFLDQQELLERFRREGIAAAGITHPNVVQIYDVGTAGDVGYLVMELVEGGSLADRVSDGGGVSVEAWIQLAKEMCSALREIHSKGIIHRDVKPANILFDKEDRAKIADFGVAHLEDAMGLTGTKVVGTVSYMAPEMLKGEAASQQSDLFALGRTLIFAATGNSKEAGLPKNFPDELQEWLDKTVAFRLENRFANMTEALEGLRRAEQGKTSSGSGGMVGKILLALVLVLALGVGGELYRRSLDDGAPAPLARPSAPAAAPAVDTPAPPAPPAAAPAPITADAANASSDAASTSGASTAPTEVAAPVKKKVSAPSVASPAPAPPKAKAGPKFVLQHSTVSRVLIGSRLKLKAVVDPTPTAVMAMLKLGGKGWQKKPMSSTGAASWSLEVPVEGNWLSGASYYIVATDSSGKTVARSGSRGSPHTLKVR